MIMALHQKHRKENITFENKEKAHVHIICEKRMNLGK